MKGSYGTAFAARSPEPDDSFFVTQCGSPLRSNPRVASGWRRSCWLFLPQQTPCVAQ